MLKLGKPKASFNKAIKEIDAYMLDPTVSCVIHSSTAFRSPSQVAGQRNRHDSGSPNHTATNP